MSFHQDNKLTTNINHQLTQCNSVSEINDTPTVIGISVVGGVIIIGIAVGIWYAATKYNNDTAAANKLTGGSQPQNNDWQLYSAPGEQPGKVKKNPLQDQW